MRLFGFWVAIVALVSVAPAHAEDNAERDCRRFVDHTAARMRAGDPDVKRDLPRLKICHVILKAALDRETGKIVASQPR
jgi:hypothetical protein